MLKQSIPGNRRLIRQGLVACVLTTLLMTACSSSDSTSVPETSAENGPLTFPSTPIKPAMLGSPPLLQDTPESIDFHDPENAFLEVVPLVNADAEMAERSGAVPNDVIVHGFTSNGPCHYSDDNVAAGNGRWRFDLLPGCVMTQASDTSLQPGQAVSVQFDAHGSASADTRIVVELFTRSTTGQEHTLSSQSFSLSSASNDWQSRQLATAFTHFDTHTGDTIGIRFSNPGDNGSVSLDKVSVQLHSRPPAESAMKFHEQWNWSCDQLWAGQPFWSNRLADWQVRNQRLETRPEGGFKPQRTTHRISSTMSTSPTDFAMSVDTGPLDTASSESFSGFLIGAGQGMDYRAAALVHNRHGRNGGLIVGIDSIGRAFIHDNGVLNQRLANGVMSEAAASGGATLQLRAQFQEDGNYLLSAYVMDSQSQIVSSTSTRISPDRMLGSIAVISNPGKQQTSHWFDNWRGAGEKLQEMPNRQFGPVLFSSYTLSQGTLTVNAQYAPVCFEAFATPQLQIGVGDQWETVASAPIDTESFTAQFRVQDWHSSQRYRYRIVTREEAHQTGQTHYFDGVIQADPINEDTFVVGVYNCRPGVLLSDTEGWIQQNIGKPFTWSRERIVMPHEELLGNSARHEPDLLAFLGDQLYEFDPNGLNDKAPENIVNDYLWKWFQFGWSVRDLMRNTPAFILPDDHDVFQPNVWGQGGIAAKDESAGGYVHPASFIGVVQRTQTGSLPPAYDPQPVAQSIDVYYTNLVYGGVGMAILEDRKFKTGASSPQQPQQLLGQRQHEFLDEWARDWRGQKMKLAFSQSPFSQSTTHSGARMTPIGVDRDSNGWPKQGRDEAVRRLRRAAAPHIAGDQHLGMMLRHGIDAPDDAIYSFSGPSMLNIFPRIWDPMNESAGPGEITDDYTGTYTDPHGNLITVLAAANPAMYYREVDTTRPARKDELGIGYGMVTIDKANRRFTFGAWPANRNPLLENRPYEGWPVSVSQSDNDGRIPTGYLQSRQAEVAEPLLVVEDESDGHLVYARRLTSSVAEVPVFDNSASYRVTLSDPEGLYSQSWQNQTTVR